MPYKIPKDKILDVSNFDTGSVETMINMFNGCTGLTTLNVSNWDVIVSIKKLNTNNVPVFVKILDGNGVTLYSKTFIETLYMIDFDDIF